MSQIRFEIHENNASQPTLENQEKDASHSNVEIHQVIASHEIDENQIIFAR